MFGNIFAAFIIVATLYAVMCGYYSTRIWGRDLDELRCVIDEALYVDEITRAILVKEVMIMFLRAPYLYHKYGRK